jgi:hypothetical protein
MVSSQLSNNYCVPVPYPSLISLYQATAFMPDVFDFSSEESTESADERGSLSEPRRPAAGPKRPPKRGPSNQYTAWTFKHKLECNFFYAESTNVLTIEEKMNLLNEHLQNRLQHDQPRAVLACAVLVDSRVYSGPPTRGSIPVTFYVQTKKTTAIPLEAWISDGSVCKPVPGGLCGNPEFDADMSKPVPWAVLQIFSKLALNNAGSRAKRVIVLFDCRAMHAITIFISCSEGDHSTRLILPF